MSDTTNEVIDIQSLSSEEARSYILRNVNTVTLQTPSNMFHARLTEDEMKVARMMQMPGTGENLWEMEKVFVGGIWQTVVNAIFAGLKPHEARIYILDRAFHPRALPKEIKEYAETGDDTLIKAHAYKHTMLLKGVKYWKKFHATYLLKGMTGTEAMKFLIDKGYVTSDIPALVFRHFKLDPKKLSFANELMRDKMPQEEVYRMIGLEK